MDRVLPNGVSFKLRFAAFLLNFSKVFLELHLIGMIRILLQVPQQICNTQGVFPFRCVCIYMKVESKMESHFQTRCTLTWRPKIINFDFWCIVNNCGLAISKKHLILKRNEERRSANVCINSWKWCWGGSRHLYFVLSMHSVLAVTLQMAGS